MTLDNGIPAKIPFIRNRNERSEWLVILSTDTTLDNEEIMRIYGMRWDIEFVPNPVCWTEAPQTLAVLRNQRRRW